MMKNAHVLKDACNKSVEQTIFGINLNANVFAKNNNVNILKYLMKTNVLVYMTLVSLKFVKIHLLGIQPVVHVNAKFNKNALLDNSGIKIDVNALMNLV